jgi:F420-dependent oxidoreductase-like protein
VTDQLRLGLMLGYWGARPPKDPIETVLAAEEVGFDSVWTAEAYGSDVFSPLCWIGARTTRIKLATGICQISARTPACTAMTAATIDHLSGGRLILGLGVSGPQVVEGWYGQPFDGPLARTREYVEVLRRIWAREGPVTHDGDHHPLPTPHGTGLGKPLKITTHPLREEIPIYIGAEGPRNVAQTTRIADGWLPVFYSPEHSAGMYADALAAARDDFDIACPVTVNVTDDVSEGLTLTKWSLAFYIGGMGAKSANFHKDVVSRMGFAAQAEKIQELFAAGRREEAAAAVPDELADGIALVGPPERIRERLQAWRDSPVTTLLVNATSPTEARRIAELVAT